MFFLAMFQSVTNLQSVDPAASVLSFVEVSPPPPARGRLQLTCWLLKKSLESWQFFTKKLQLPIISLSSYNK